MGHRTRRAQRRYNPDRPRRRFTLHPDKMERLGFSGADARERRDAMFQKMRAETKHVFRYSSSVGSKMVFILAYPQN